ncbi:MAG: hypothetical protein EA412_00655 [Chitinophagaceae bacterium]|nr:MAG: hypothetical protein EA412_00655 [Chitinophagaceae bacterium]
MEKYINQLINDIRATRQYIAAQNNLNETTDFEDKIEMGDFSHVEQYIYGEGIPISTITTIDVSLLPPEDKLTLDQKAVLAEELEKLLEVKHFALDFPENLPMHMRYPLIRKFWSEKHVEMSFGTSHIEFCQYEPDNCPYPDYCVCKDFEEYNNEPDNATEEGFDQTDLDERPF